MSRNLKEVYDANGLVYLPTGALFYSALPNFDNPATSNAGIAKQDLYTDVITSSTFRSACVVATTAALTATYNNGVLGVGATLTNSGAQAALTIDTQLLVVGDRVCVKDQVAPAQNGIYVVTIVGDGSTNWVLTRASDFDNSHPGSIALGVAWLISAGSANLGKSFYVSVAGPFTVGTTAIVITLTNNDSPGAGDVDGPASATDNAIARYDGTTGKIIKNSGATLDDVGNIVLPAGASFTTLNGWFLAGNNAATVFSAKIEFLKSRAGAAVQVGDTVGNLNYSAWDGATYIVGSKILSTVYGTVGTNRVATDLAFYTHPDSTAVSALRMQISYLGKVTILAPDSGDALDVQGSVTLPAVDGNNAGSVVKVVTMAASGGQLGTANLVAGTGVDIDPTANTITISATGSGVTWNTITATSAALAVNNAYITDNASLVTLTLPLTASVGSTIPVRGFGAGGWKIAQNAGQQIINGTSLTTIGVGGYAASTNQYDDGNLECIVADTTWKFTAVQGTPTFI